MGSPHRTASNQRQRPSPSDTSPPETGLFPKQHHESVGGKASPSPFPSARHSELLCLLRNHNKPHLRAAIPTADRSAGLLDNPALFPSFSTERLNGVRSSPPTRLPASQNRTRLPSNTAFPRRDPVGTGRVPEPATPDYSRGR